MVTVNTDNRTVSDTTMTRELLLGHAVMGLTVAELADMTLTAVEAGFGERAERRDLLETFKEEMRGLGIL